MNAAIEMKSKHILSLLFLSLGIVLTNAQTVDSETSLVSFEIRKLNKQIVEGTIKGMTGNAFIDPLKTEKSRIDVCIKPSTIDTENRSRDKHLKSKDYLDVEQHPRICYKSTSIKKSREGYLAYGNLTLHGITKSVEIPLTYHEGQFVGSFKINRLDFEVGPDGTKTVGNEITLSIVCNTTSSQKAE